MKTKYLLRLIIFLSCTCSFAQLGIGTNNPNPSAQLEVVSNDKGILIPKVSLTSDTDATTISNGNIESLLVYNTNSSNGLSIGYYYWTNGLWERVAVASDITSLPEDVTSTDGSISGVAASAALAAMDLQVNVDDASIEVDATNGVQVKDDGITTAKILDDNVTVSKMGATVGDASKLLGTDASGNVEWQDASAISASLGEDVTSTDGSISGVTANAALAAMDLQVNVDDASIEVDATNGVQVKDDGITTTKILDDNVTVSKMGANVGDANKLMGTDASGNVEWQDASAISASLGEDVTSTDGSISGVTANAALATMDLQVNVDDVTIEVDATNGVQVKDNGITTAKIADDAVTITKIGTAGVSDANKILTTDASGDPQWETQSIYIVGEIKQTLGSMPAGWVKLEGQAISSLTATQQAQAASLGLSGSLPDARNKYLSQTGNPLGSTSGSNSKTIAQNNLPNVALSGSTNTTGAHSHYIYGNTSDDLSGAGGNVDYVLSNNDGVGTGEWTSTEGNHAHSLTTSSINGGVTQQALDVTPSTLSVDTYIYLGE